MPLFVVTGIVSILLIPPDTDQNGPKFSINKHKKKHLVLPLPVSADISPFLNINRLSPLLAHTAQSGTSRNERQSVS